MDLGVIIGDVPTTVPPREHVDQLLAQVEATQRAGIRYLTIGQHFLYGDQRWLQPVPLLARLAAEVDAGTKLATAVLLLPLHHPVVLAEELATLDIVTAGRLIVGVGLGYRTAEYAALGVPFEERVPRFTESLELLRALWTQPVVDHHGRFFDVAGEPHIRPWQDPHPPLWVGAQVAAGVRRSARHGDAWPIGPNLPVDEVEALLAVYVDERRVVGRPMGRQPIRRDVAFGRNRDDAFARFLEGATARYESYAAKEHRVFRAGADATSIADALASHLVAGTVEECAAQLTDLAARVPIDPVIVRPHWPGTSHEEVLTYLDRLGELAALLADVESVPPPDTDAGTGTGTQNVGSTGP